MPSQRKKAPTSGNANSSLKSDDEILKDRKRLEAFDTADAYLNVVAWSLWGLALLWFLYFSDYVKAPAPAWHHGAADPCAILVVSGVFCRGISKASPRAWSMWRMAFHLAWCPCWGLIALATVQLATAGSSALSSSNCWLSGLAFGGLAAGAVLTFPGASPASGKGCASAMPRLALLIDGVVVLAVAWSIFRETLWSDKLGPIASAIAVLPLLPLAGAFWACCTDAELLVAVPSVMLYSLWASLRAWYLSDTHAAVACIVAIVMHALFYLPLGSDPESNPFYMSLVRFARQMRKMMSQPVSGFGDDGES